MVINYYGKAFVRLSFGDMVVAINPISKSSDAKSSRFGADIALSSLNDVFANGGAELSLGSKDPFIINGPGEYELSDVFVRGYESEGPKDKINTIYTVSLEGMKVCHLGALANPEINPDIFEEISGADILFVPVGDEETISAKESAKLVSSLIPKLIVPVLYGDNEKSELLAEFLKEIGSEKTKPEEKLSIKKKDLENREADVAVLKKS